MARVKIYTTTNCKFCRVAKDFFRTSNISFEEINVEQDPQAAMEMIDRSGQMSVPVIEIGNDIIVGFDKNRITEALQR